MAALTRQQQKDYAKKLFLTEQGIAQKEIAKRTGVSEQTIGKWIKEGRWEDLKKSLITTKEEQLAWMYDQLSAIRNAIDQREPDKRFPSSSEADTINKLASSIKKLETETSIGEIVEIGKKFLVWLRAADPEQALAFLPLYDAFIKDSM